MKNQKFGFIFSEFAQFSDIYEFEDVTWCSGGEGYGFGETAREAILNACKYAYQDCTLWDVPRDPVGYLVEFDENGNIVSIKQQTLCIVGETTYTIKFTDNDSETFFKAAN